MGRLETCWRCDITKYKETCFCKLDINCINMLNGVPLREQRPGMQSFSTTYDVTLLVFHDAGILKANILNL